MLFVVFPPSNNLLLADEDAVDVCLENPSDPACAGNQPPYPTPHAPSCPQDTQTCSDGSVVSRNPGDGCNFYACPNNPAPTYPTPAAPAQACTPNQFDAGSCRRCASDGSSWGTDNSDYGPSTGSAEWCACAARAGDTGSLMRERCSQAPSDRNPDRADDVANNPTDRADRCEDLVRGTTCGQASYDTCAPSCDGSGKAKYDCYASQNTSCRGTVYCAGENNRCANTACAQVITYAKLVYSGECRAFPTPCDVPAEWVRVANCSADPSSGQVGGVAATNCPAGTTPEPGTGSNQNTIVCIQQSQTSTSTASGGEANASGGGGGSANAGGGGGGSAQTGATSATGGSAQTGAVTAQGGAGGAGGAGGSATINGGGSGVAGVAARRTTVVRAANGQQYVVRLAGASYQVNELPKTGLPALAWATLAFIPIGEVFKRFGKGKYTSRNFDDPDFISDRRTFQKSS